MQLGTLHLYLMPFVEGRAALEVAHALRHRPEDVLGEAHPLDALGPFTCRGSQPAGGAGCAADRASQYGGTMISETSRVSTYPARQVQRPLSNRRAVDAPTAEQSRRRYRTRRRDEGGLQAAECGVASEPAETCLSSKR